MPADNPLISVVIPTYNRASLIAKTLESVFSQTYPYFEIIVVDDGSTDNTEEIVGRMKDARLFYFKKENAERAAARNYGMSKAKGGYITYLDSDDLLYPDALRYAAESINRMNNPPFLHMGYEMGSEEKIFRKIDRLPDNDPMVLRSGNPLSCMGIFIKKEVTKDFIFNEDRLLTGSEDWEYWLRLAANFGLRTDNRIIGRLIEHDTRSVMKVTEEQLLKRKELSFKYAFSDAAVRKIYSPYRKRMEAFWNLYLSLHLAMSKKKRKAMKYLAKSFFGFPPVLFTKRFFVVIKKMA
jgi:glycosyltransferase involved in cell wall biosynthesis